jgi:hypothetical protein
MRPSRVPTALGVRVRVRVRAAYRCALRVFPLRACLQQPLVHQEGRAVAVFVVPGRKSRVVHRVRVRVRVRGGR